MLVRKFQFSTLPLSWSTHLMRGQRCANKNRKYFRQFHTVQKNNLISISSPLPGMKTLLSKQENALKETVEKPKIL